VHCVAGLVAVDAHLNSAVIGVARVNTPAAPHFVPLAAHRCCTFI